MNLKVDFTRQGFVLDHQIPSMWDNLRAVIDRAMITQNREVWATGTKVRRGTVTLTKDFLAGPITVGAVALTEPGRILPRPQLDFKNASILHM